MALRGPGLPDAARRAAAHVFVADAESPALDPGDAHHLLRVLRLRPGEAVSVADPMGRWRPCRLCEGGVLEPDGETLEVVPASPAVTVALAAPKGERLEWAVAKLTELGVDRIVILATDRSVVRWEPDRQARHLQRLRSVAHAAAMQSRLAAPPSLEGQVTLDSFVAGSGSGSGSGSAARVAAGVAAGVALAGFGGDPPTLATPAVAVGPEGGWSPDELAAAPAVVGLSPTVLRTETAAVAAGVLLVSLREQALNGLYPQLTGRPKTLPTYRGGEVLSSPTFSGDHRRGNRL